MNTGARRSAIALWVALVLAGSILALMARGAGPLPGDLALTRWLQEWPPPDGPAGSLLAYASRLVWSLAVAFLAIALLLRRWLAALFVLVAAATSLLLGDALKLLVARARPSVELVRVYESPGGYGFPSTTALLSLVLPGAACYLVWQERPRRPPSSCFALRFFVVGVGERHLARSCRGALGDRRLGRLALRKRLVAYPDIDPSLVIVEAGTIANDSVGGAGRYQPYFAVSPVTRR